MYAVASSSGKKTWQTRRERVSVEAALAIQRENVMQRLIRLREEIGHPEKQGEPLPQDQAAARAGVTARQWQRWESGVSVPYARNLSAVADAFSFDVAEFYDGPAGGEPALTPSPFAEPDENRTLTIMNRVEILLQQQNELLTRQSLILERIEAAIDREDEAAARRDAESARRLHEAVQEASQVLTNGSSRSVEAPEPQAR